MVGVSWMGVLHTAVMIAGMSIVAFFSVRHIGGLDAQVRPSRKLFQHNRRKADEYACQRARYGYLVPRLLQCHCRALFGSKEKSANGGMIIAGLLTLPFALMPAIIGICAKVYLPDISSGSAVCHGKQRRPDIRRSGQHGDNRRYLVHCAVSSHGHFRYLHKRTFLLRGHQSARKRKAAAALFICSYRHCRYRRYVARHGRKPILNQMLGAFQIRSVVGVVLLAALAWPRVNSRAAFWSMMGGGIVAAGWFFAGNPFGIAPLWAGNGGVPHHPYPDHAVE